MKKLIGLNQFILKNWSDEIYLLKKKLSINFSLNIFFSCPPVHKKTKIKN